MDLSTLLASARRLAEATTAAALKAALAEYPELAGPAVDPALTRAIEAETRAGQVQSVCGLLAVRAFLADYRTGGLAAALNGAPLLPLVQTCPLPELARPVNDPARLPQRISQAEQALRQLRRDSEPVWWATVQCVWADALAQLPDGDRAGHLQQAAQHYSLALPAWLAGQAIPGWKSTWLKLNRAWQDYVRLDPARHIPAAISFYESVLPALAPDQAPAERAMVLYALGSLYCQWPGGHHAGNIEQAITCYQEALNSLNQQPGSPQDQAVTRVGLANAYFERIYGEKAENIERAIQEYQQVLDLRAHEPAGVHRAEVQHNLAVAYRRRRLGQPAQNFETAIGHAQAALTVYTEKEFPQEWATIQNELAALYSHRPQGDRAENLEQAIGYYRLALNVYTRQAYPLQWAYTQNNLANVYCDRLRGYPQANLAEAVKRYHLALEVRTEAEYPRQWGETQNNLGTAYAVQGRLGQAAACYQAALRVRTSGTLPEGARQTARNQGFLYFQQKEWSQAHAAFSQALQAAEQLYLASATEAGKHSELAENAPLSAAEAYCLARLGHYQEAVVTLEQGRARLLAESLARDRAQLAQAGLADRRAFAEARDRLKALEAEQHVSPPPRPFTEIAAALRAAHADLAGIAARIRAGQPDFMSAAGDFATLVKAARPGQPLVYLITTVQGSLALVVPAGAERLTSDQVIWLDHFKEADLINLLGQGPGKQAEPAGYLPASFSDQPAMLRAALDHSLAGLGRQLMAPLAERLRSLGLFSMVLIPGGRLSLLPLHAASSGQGYFLDEFQVTYAPSAQTLSHCHRRLAEVAALPPALLAVGNPASAQAAPLPYARTEIEAIAALFPAGTRCLLLEHQASHPGVLHRLNEAAGHNFSHLHFACHGVFNPTEPLTSGLLLAHHQRLTLADLFDRLSLKPARLAVLSACQTAVTDFNRVPDEAIGLPSGFLNAGVPGVVGSLWPVSDISTSLLVAQFYRLHLQEGAGAAAALRQAQLWLRRATAAEIAAYFEKQYLASGEQDQAAFLTARHYRTVEPDLAPFAHPYFWAAFTFAGAGT